MTRRAGKIATLMIAAAVLGFSVWYIVTTFQWAEIRQVVETADPLWLLPACGSILLYWLLRTLRWFLLLRSAVPSVAFADLYWCSALALGLAIVTPMQSGEMLKMEMLKKYLHVDRASGYSAFVVERVSDLVVVCGLAMTGLAVAGGPAGGLSRPTLGYFCLSLMAGVLAGSAVIWRCRFPGWIGRFQAHLRRCLSDGWTLPAVMGLTVVCWLVTALGWYVCLLGIGVDIGWLWAVMLTSTMTLVNLLSFIPGAVGVSEAGISLLLLQWGQAPPQAQAGAIILRGYSVLILVCGILHLPGLKILKRTSR